MNNCALSGLVVGIDATNLRGGGGVTHLIELVISAVPASHGITKIVIWGGETTLAKLPDRAWLEKVSPAALNQGLLARTLWQRFSLSRMARAARCDVLFVPGGSYAGSFRPMVTMSRNLLPFEWPELNRYGTTLMALKLRILRYTQSRSFKGADAVIFLTDYAKQAVLEVTGPLAAKTATIPHGLSTRFLSAPKLQRPIATYSASNPFRLIYVSIIDQYKHQWHVVEAVHILRAQGLPVVLELIGPAYPPALARLQAAITQFDPEKLWVRYHGAVPYEALHTLYAQADLGLFASSCENMPNILLETMAAGLPVACSNRGPMPEVLGDDGLYFDPENPINIANTLHKFISNPELRSNKAQASFARSQQFSWSRCADSTLRFLAEVADKKLEKANV
jgi:glycosyltransferase involved in cell wall biosynthesis